MDKTEKLIRLVCGEKPRDVCVLTIQQLVRTMEHTCSVCQADRKYVLLDPQCKDRFYLSLLVEAGVPYNEYPLDCYKIRVEEVKKIIQGKPTPVSVVDAVIRLKDFLKAMIDGLDLSASKRKISAIKNVDKLIEFVQQIPSENNLVKTYVWEKKAYLSIIREKSIILNLLDFDRDLAYVNLWDRPIRPENVEHAVKHLLDVYGVQGELYTSPTGNIYIKFHVPKEKLKEVLNREYKLQILETKESSHILALNIQNFQGETIRYRDLLNFIGSISGAYGE